MKTTLLSFTLLLIGSLTMAEQMESRSFSMEIRDRQSQEIAIAGNPGHKTETVKQCYHLDKNLYPILVQINEGMINLKKANEQFNYQAQMNLFTSLRCKNVLKSSRVAFEQAIQEFKQEDRRYREKNQIKENYERYDGYKTTTEINEAYNRLQQQQHSRPTTNQAPQTAQ